MSDFKEFQGKTLDAAIADACAYYDAPREKLEIDIVEDAKSGIFGLVGVRKARILARRAQLPDMPRKGRQKANSPAASAAGAPALFPASLSDETLLPSEPDEDGNVSGRESDEADKTAENPAEKSGRGKRGRGRGRAGASTAESAPRARDDGEAAGDEAEDETAGEDDALRRASSHEQEGEGRFPPRVKLADLDQDKLREVTESMLRGLVAPILDDEDFTLDIQMEDERVQARIQCDDTGLLIGRDGQNLAAVQYLAARMISRAMDAQVHLQVDAGDYHSRQDSRLQELALALADKVRDTGKPQATRAMSAYQRRVIHLTLQDDPDVQTRSVGEGALKRVIVQRRKD